MNESRATRYQRLRRRGHVASWVSAGLMLAVVAVTPAGAWLSDLFGRVSGSLGLPGWLAALLPGAAFVMLLVVLWEVAALPAALYVALRVDPAYRRTNGSIRETLKAHLEAAAVALPAALFSAAVVTGTVALLGAGWWIAAAPIFALALVGAVHGGPVLLARMGTVRPLVRADLGAVLSDLARAARVPVADIQEWVVGESTRTTALVTGVGQSRRVLINSVVARTWRVDEVAVVVAHELAHHAHHDLWRALGLNAAVLCGALWGADVAVRWTGSSLGITGPGDLSALPLMALVGGAVWLSCTPLRHAQSRRQEHRADVFALEATGRADAFAAAIRRLGERQLVEDRPTTLTRWLYHRHPPVSERLALAEAYRRANTPA